MLLSKAKKVHTWHAWGTFMEHKNLASMFKILQNPPLVQKVNKFLWLHVYKQFFDFFFLMVSQVAV
jgi:hypothetical protein